MMHRRLLIALALALPLASIAEPSAPSPKLTYVFSLRATLAPAVEQGQVDGKRRRFIAVTGGTVYGPRLQGEVLTGGGDWQAIANDGRTEIDTRYSLKATDGTVIGVFNPGVRTASPAVIAKLAAGADVPPDAYYFRTTPRFDVGEGPYGWLRRQVFVARGIRKPDHVVIDIYAVE